jgi:hypothetical protein
MILEILETEGTDTDQLPSLLTTEMPRTGEFLACLLQCPVLMDRLDSVLHSLEIPSFADSSEWGGIPQFIRLLKTTLMDAGASL